MCICGQELAREGRFQVTLGPVEPGLSAKGRTRLLRAQCAPKMHGTALAGGGEIDEVTEDFAVMAWPSFKAGPKSAFEFFHSMKGCEGRAALSR
jgi:hypothetical protein